MTNSTMYNILFFFTFLSNFMINETKWGNIKVIDSIFFFLLNEF